MDQLPEIRLDIIQRLLDNDTPIDDVIAAADKLTRFVFFGDVIPSPAPPQNEVADSAVSP